MKGTDMNTQISNKLARFGRVLNVIGKIFAILCFIAAGIALIAMIVVALTPDDFILQTLNMLRIDASNTFINGNAFGLAVAGVKIGAIFALVKLLVEALFYAAVLLVLSLVFKSTAVNKTPFSMQNAKRLKIIGIILIIISIPFGLGNLVFAFCVFAFAYVLQYGAELQILADETL